MKRLLQAVSGVLLLLACAIGWRMGQVMRVSPPTFEDPPQVASSEPLPPLPKQLSPRGAAKDAVVDGNLFEPERGAEDEEIVDGEAAGEKAPLPPPTNVVLNGVFVMRGEPMAIVTDSNAGNKQLTLYVGDNVGDYQVGEITERRVTLLGNGGQQFSLDLAIKKGGGAASAARAPIAPRTPGRTTPGAPAPAAARSPTAAQRAAAQRAANQAQAAANEAQTPAARAAAARAAAADRNAASQRRPQANPQQRQIDAAQARLDALRRLREASQAN